MFDLIFPVIFVIFLWWASTTIILAFDGIRGNVLWWTSCIVLVIFLSSATGAAFSARSDTLFSTYIGLICALLMWGSIEFAFLTGVLTGPSRIPAAVDARFQDRLSLAIMAILHHEIALLVTIGLLVLISWQEVNEIALHSFLLLWIMRQSTKINLFLGVRNFSEKLLPHHLLYISSFFKRAAMNGFFPVSVCFSGGLTAWLFMLASQNSHSPSDQAAFGILASISMLALLEHLFLVLPLPSDSLWSLGVRFRAWLSARGASL